MDATLGKKSGVPVVRINPNNVSSVYSNDLAATFSGTEIFITFSLIEPPIISEADLKNLNQIESKAVAKLVLTPEFTEQVMGVLSGLLSQYKSKVQK